MRVFPHTRCYIHVRRCENTRRGTCLHRFSLLSYLSSQSLKNFSWGACSRSGFSLHKSTNCLSKESWKLSNFEAIFTSKSVTPSLRLLSWVKKLSHDPLRQACNFVYVDAMLPFGKIFAIRYCQTKSFWGDARRSVTFRNTSSRLLLSVALSNSKVAWFDGLPVGYILNGRKLRKVFSSCVSWCHWWADE